MLVPGDMSLSGIDIKRDRKDYLPAMCSKCQYRLHKDTTIIRVHAIEEGTICNINLKCPQRFDKNCFVLALKEE